MKNCGQSGRKQPYDITSCDLHAFADENAKFQSGRHLYALVIMLVSLPKLQLLISFPDLKNSRTLLTLVWDANIDTHKKLYVLLTVHHNTSVQYSKTNVMHFLFNLLRINGLYMFRALLTHLQEALHKRNLAYCVRFISVRCTRLNVNPIYQVSLV
jgi:hypothetical protein